MDTGGTTTSSGQPEPPKKDDDEKKRSRQITIDAASLIDTADTQLLYPLEPTIFQELMDYHTYGKHH